MRLMGRALGISALVLLLASPAFSQGFGKNKVHYEPLDWAVLETPHLRLHYYAQEESLARRLVTFAESVCVEFDERFRITPENQVPFLLYSSHHLFQQTNASPGLISEGTGGLTELIKGRVLLPHPGSWDRLEWVTRHELVHWYMLEKISTVMRAHKRTQNYLPPLWFIEGLAEFGGTYWDADAEGLLRDAVTSRIAVPLTRSEEIYGSVLMYKEGQSFLLYVAERFGEERIWDMFDNWWRYDTFEQVFEKTIGLPLAQVDQDWFRDLRKRYYPAVATTRTPGETGRRLTRKGRYNLGPRALPSRSPADTTVRFCYFAAGETAIELKINEPDGRGGRRERRVLRGHQSPEFESFHLFQNRPDASVTGRIVVSSKRGGRDAIYLVDGIRGRILRRLEFPNLVAIHDPCLVPGDSAIIFSAQDYSGRSDLYRATWPDGRVALERLTNDDYDDVEPDVSPDGRWVAFASDRADRGGEYSLFRLALQGGVPHALSDPPIGSDRQPVYSPDGTWIAFRSTRGGTSDLWVRPAGPALQASRVTRLLGPASDPDWLPDSKGLLFTAQHEFTFHTYQLRFDPESLVSEPEPASERVPLLVHEVYTDPPKPYQRRLGFDLVQNAIALDPGLGAGGAGQIALSDVLGNEQIYVYLANTAEQFGGGFWENFEGGLTYLNRSRRLNYGIGAFSLNGVYDPDLDLVRLERRLGMVLLASYPFNKFTRVEASLLARHADNHLLRSGEFRDVDLVSNYLSLVHDNTGWTWLGPSTGFRMLTAAGYTRDLTSGAGDYGTVLGEARYYKTLAPHLVAATRVQGQASLGRDAQRFYLGGWFSLRGYERRELAGLQTLIIQQDVRFPLLRGVVLGVPSPWMLPPVSGVLIGDVAWAWDDGFEHRLGSLGAGWYIGGGYFPAIGVNYVWLTRDFQTFSDGPKTQFRLSFNF
jgi:Tol biopolymer transport system component